LKSSNNKLPGGVAARPQWFLIALALGYGSRG
jgi:hypothetical protein